MKTIAAILIASVALTDCDPPEPEACEPQENIPCTYQKCGECGSAGGTWTRHEDCSVTVQCNDGPEPSGPGEDPIDEVLYELDSY